MAKAKKKIGSKEEFEAFATRKPKLTVLTDEPLRTEEASEEKFNLRYKVGPVYDILRYPRTETPMAILISGSWGTSKTSAMRWLHGLLDIWNKKAGADDIKVRPVWFYPWKYDNKEDVRRGLIASVVLNAIDVSSASRKTVRKAFKLLGTFVGKSALDLIAGQKISVAGFEVSGKAVQKIIDHYQEAAHPEKPYLHPFETVMETWVKDSLGKSQRMVIFIDDLDRCMPEIALQVLEALKLYLNIEKLIFVVGVDKDVVEKLVVEHYKKLGLVKSEEKDKTEEGKKQEEAEEAKAKQYLSKMFQVEVNLEPTEMQISDFFDEQLKELTYWEKYLSPDEQNLFRDLVLEFAGRNPREVKRLLNSALMTGAGAIMSKSAAKANNE